MAGEKIDKAVHSLLEQGRKDLGVKVYVSAEPQAPAVAPAAAPAAAGSEAPAAPAAPAPAK